MQAITQASTLVGIDAFPVEVEVRLARGLPRFDIVGLPEAAVREARVRVDAAIESCGYGYPKKRLVLNMAPADLRKTGSGFDLAIAIAVLCTSGACAPNRCRETLILGELSLAGELRPVRGVLAHLRAAAARGMVRAIVPSANAWEASLAAGLDIEVHTADSLKQVVAFLNATGQLPRAKAPSTTTLSRSSREDLSEVCDQHTAKRALEIAAAGNHNLLLVGPPGAGKTMLAKRLPSLLPLPSQHELLDIAMIHSIAGSSNPDTLTTRPFRAPHHTISDVALVGGGNPIRPGEVTLAHGGVLFLDELPEFRRSAVEALRTTIEGGIAEIARCSYRVCMPAQSLIVAAMNPCPCGFAGHKRQPCYCTPERVRAYRAKVSGPLLDRFDLHMHVPALPPGKLKFDLRSETSATVRDRVRAARKLLSDSKDVSPHNLNGPEREPEVERLAAQTSGSGLQLLELAVKQFDLSARGYVRVLRVAKTIASLAGATQSCQEQVAEALQYRFSGWDHERVSAPAFQSQQTIKPRPARNEDSSCP